MHDPADAQPAGQHAAGGEALAAPADFAAQEPGFDMAAGAGNGEQPGLQRGRGVAEGPGRDNPENDGRQHRQESADQPGDEGRVPECQEGIAGRTGKLAGRGQGHGGGPESLRIAAVSASAPVRASAGPASCRADGLCVTGMLPAIACKKVFFATPGRQWRNTISIFFGYD